MAVNSMRIWSDVNPPDRVKNVFGAQWVTGSTGRPSIALTCPSEAVSRAIYSGYSCTVSYGSSLNIGTRSYAHAAGLTYLDLLVVPAGATLRSRLGPYFRRYSGGLGTASLCSAWMHYRT